MKRTLVIICMALGVAGLGDGILSTVPTAAQFFFLENPLVGEEAPDFTLQTLKEGKQSLHAYRAGGPAIVFFWATWCPHCRTHLNALRTKAGELRDQGIHIILVDQGEDPKQVSAYLEKAGLTFPVFMDQTQEVSEEYGVFGLPTLFFISADGKIQAVEHSLPRNYAEILQLDPAS